MAWSNCVKSLVKLNSFALVEKSLQFLICFVFVNLLFVMD